ncbi:Hexosaminidase D [Toxocara canis]|uniref:beta-N-acetylhexosaminidase n=1 Tax=Toxocara canis TaxID=6265 RepID=A0A0B2URF4_TOXCA|nr:Hexosaminidase D [Toxocara canis]
MLEENRCTESYTLDEVRDLLGSAQKLELDIIPLVQTFGHLEWILKLDKFRKYRQSDEHPQVVCLADESGIALVKEAIKQVVDVHKEFGVKFFHIGADEAFEVIVCLQSHLPLQNST